MAKNHGEAVGCELGNPGAQHGHVIVEELLEVEMHCNDVDKLESNIADMGAVGALESGSDKLIDIVLVD